MKKSILTKREKEVFELLIKNESTKDIAISLKISEKTVRNHISNAMQKLGVKGRAGCSQGCKTDLRFAAGLHKERNAKGTGRRYGDEVSAEGTYSQG